MIRAIAAASTKKARARRRPGLLVVAVALVVLVGACTGEDPGRSTESSPIASRPSATIQQDETPPPGLLSPSSYIKEVEPVLDDQTGLATEVTTVAAATNFEEGLSTEPSGEPNVVVSWFGSPCELEPTVRLEGTAAQLQVTVYRGPVLPVECPAMQVYRAVRIGVTSVVDLAMAVYSVREGMPPE